MASGIRLAIFSVTGAMLVSKLLGFVRELVIARYFGTSAEYDLYLIAIILPALFYGILNYAGYNLLVPLITCRWTDGSPSHGISREVGWSLGVATALAVAIALLAPVVMKVWAGDLPAADYDRVVFYCRVMAGIVTLGTAEAIQRAILNVRSVYVYPAVSYTVFNLVAISAMVFWHSQYSVGAIAIGFLAGLAAQNLYLLARVVGLPRKVPSDGAKRSTADRLVVATAAMLVLIELVNRSYFMFDRYFAPDFGAGIVSGLAYGQVLVTLPDAVMGFAIGTVLFPRLAAMAASDDDSAFGALYGKALSVTLLVAAPIAALTIIGAEDIVRVVFQRGAFNDQSVATTAQILRPLAPTILALAVVSASVRACYARMLARPVLGLAAMTLLIKGVATWLLSSWVGYAGISAATSLAYLVFALGLIMILNRRRGLLPSGILSMLGRVIVVNVIAAVAVWLLYPEVTGWLGADDGSFATIIRLKVAGLCYLVIYLAALRASGLWHLVETVTKRQPAVEEAGQ